MKKLLHTVFALVIALCTINAKAELIDGKVTSKEDGMSLIGVTVSVKGTKIGTKTKNDGTFQLDVPKESKLLVFSYLGFKRAEVEINDRKTINVSMEVDKIQTGDVVVTALGVERNNKELGYSVQELDGNATSQARETNIVNALAGKIAGVTVVGSPSGIGGSSRVTIRGERSLNISNNQPLFVVDGVPITNQVVGSTGNSNQEVDYGNGAGVVNPDDIETITVLKGANATALYGSRANNGAILITTKSAKGSGFGVSFNSTTSYETALRLPEYQNVYGQGADGQFSFVDGSGGGLRDGTDESWGPKFDGQLIPQFNSPRVDANGNAINYRGGDTKSAPAGSTIVPTAWVARPDNVKDFFEVGQTRNNNIAFSGSNNFGDFRLSLTNLAQTGIVPNTDLERNTISFNGSYKLTEDFTVKTVVNYIKSNSGNRPNLSYGTENIMYLFNCWLGRSDDVSAMRDYWQRDLDGLQQFASNYNYHDNPYFQLYENTNSQSFDRIFGNISLKYNILDNLSLQLRSGTDFQDEIRERRRAYSTQRFRFGQYRQENVTIEEINSDLLLTYNTEFNEDWTALISLGGNQMEQKNRITSVVAPELTIPEIYNLTNSRVNPLASQIDNKKRINSLYGTTNFGYKNYLFLDISARNDWSSTLPIDNNSYFYPSASISAVMTDMLEMPEEISFLKLRAGVAQVGNDTDPYRLTQPFLPGGNFGATVGYSESGELANSTLKPEISTSVEFGFEYKMFENRIGLDFTYYQTNSKNQILPVQLSNTSGYNTRLLNAGEIFNWGIEAALTGTIIKTDDGFKWDAFVNFSMNRSEVIELAEGVKNYVIASRYITVEAREGGRMGDMYAIGYQRVTDASSPYFGQIIHGTNGRPLRSTERIKVGNYNPDWLAGIGTSVNYQGLSASVLFDYRSGGQVYSHTQTVGREGGQIIETLEGRADGYDLTKDGNGVVSEGVIKLEDGTYKPNDVKLTAREWHSAITSGRNILEDMVYDATYLKLREIRIGYTLPNEWTKDLFLRNVQISFVGRNLAILYSNVPHIDPETSSLSGNTIIPGVESVAMPSSRSMGFNINFQF